MLPVSGVAGLWVRMYRNLLGDCFLVRMMMDDGATRHMLIDCGLLQGLDGAADRMRAIADDIATTCGGIIDLLVITHEHWDHISGFAQARDILLDPARVKYRRLWMAWTEKQDPQAMALRERFERRKTSVVRLASALSNSQASGLGADELDNVHRFIGPATSDGLGAAPGGRLTGRLIMEELKRIAEGVDYLEPGTVLGLPMAPGLEVAVLGPPRDEEKLFQDGPSAGAGKETYLAEEAVNFSMLPDGAPKDDELATLVSPFAPRYSAGLGVDAVKAGATTGGPCDGVVSWLNARYYAADDPDERRPQGYRRIDDVALQGAQTLALKLDSDTNNTSLVLALRLPDDGGFLLFAADAQVGNWLSWHDHSYRFADGALSAEAILNQVKLYKVGHHGSHNATLREKGLLMMTRPDLVAMVSTIEDVARQQGRPPGWLMPNPLVKAALLQQCRGRLIIGDRPWKGGREASGFGPQPAFEQMLDESSDLYVELRLL